MLTGNEDKATVVLGWHDNCRWMYFLVRSENSKGFLEKKASICYGWTASKLAIFELVKKWLMKAHTLPYILSVFKVLLYLE